MPPLKPKIRDGLGVADFGEDMVVCESSSGHSHFHYLNPSAALVFRLCDGTGTPAEFAADIADLYGIPVKAVERDVRDTVRIFRREGMLTAKPVVRRRAVEHEHDHDHDHDHDQDHDGEASDGRARIRREVPPNE